MIWFCRLMCCAHARASYICNECAGFVFIYLRCTMIYIQIYTMCAFHFYYALHSTIFFSRTVARAIGLNTFAHHIHTHTHIHNKYTTKNHMMWFQMWPVGRFTMYKYLRNSNARTCVFMSTVIWIKYIHIHVYVSMYVCIFFFSMWGLWRITSTNEE